MLNRNLPNATNAPVLVQNVDVDILAVDGVLKVRLDDEVAEVDLESELAHGYPPTSRIQILDLRQVRW